MRFYLRSSDFAWSLQNGEPRLQYLAHLLHTSIYYIPAPLIFGIGGYRSLVAGLSAAAAIQVFVNAYFAYNRSEIEKKLQEADGSIAGLPSAADAVRIIENSENRVGRVAWAVVQRSPIIALGYRLTGIPWTTSIAAALMSSALVEYSVLETIGRQI